MASSKLTVPILLEWNDIQAYMEQHDIVEVVRCKDCKYYNERKVMNCSYHINAVKENWFCSQGEKVTE